MVFLSIQLIFSIFPYHHISNYSIPFLSLFKIDQISHFYIIMMHTNIFNKFFLISKRILHIVNNLLFLLKYCFRYSVNYFLLPLPPAVILLPRRSNSSASSNNIPFNRTGIECYCSYFLFFQAKILIFWFIKMYMITGYISCTQIPHDGGLAPVRSARVRTRDRCEQNMTASAPQLQIMFRNTSIK